MKVHFSSDPTNLFILINVITGVGVSEFGGMLCPVAPAYWEPPNINAVWAPSAEPPKVDLVFLLGKCYPVSLNG